MDATIPVTDTTHATFWRRLVRWLVDGVPDPVSITTAVDRVEPGEPMKLTAEVVDPAFAEVNDAQVVGAGDGAVGQDDRGAAASGPSPRDGEYRGTFVPDEAGLYEVQATAVRAAGQRRSSARACCTRARRPATASTSTPRCARRCCKRIAEDTGGRFFTPSDAVRAARSDQLQRPRRDRRRGARSVGHADRSCSCCSALIGARMGLPARSGACA